MGWGKNRVTRQDIEEEFGFSEPLGSYRVPGVLSFPGLLGSILFIIYLGYWIRGSLPAGVAALVGGITVGFIGLDLAWNQLTRRLVVRRYLLYPEGLIKVGWFGARSWVMWPEVSRTKVGANYNFLGYRVCRVDLLREDGTACKIFLMGFMPRLPRDLAAAMRKTAVRQ